VADKKTARDPLVQKVEATVRRHNLLPRGKTLAIAVSGGPDSVVLLAALAEIAPRWGCRLAVLHVNHGLRGRESGEDAHFVRRLAARYEFAYHAAKLDLGKTLKSRQIVSEGLLREKRYEAIERLAHEGGAAVVALGHHRDDLAETILMHLLRGSGPAGLGGFRPKSHRGDVIYIRPLYDCTRTEVLEFCERRGLRWREDRTNRDKRWLRNRIRHELLPMLEKTYNPRLRDLLADNARWFQEDETFFEARAREVLGLTRRKGRPPKSLSLAIVRAAAPPVLARLFRIWIMTATGLSLPPTAKQIEDLIALIQRPTSRGEVRCAGGVTFFVQSDVLTWKPTMPNKSLAQSEEDHLPCYRPGQTHMPLFRAAPAGEQLPPAGMHKIVSADRRTILQIGVRRYNRHRQPRLFERAFRHACSETHATALEQCFDADQIEGPLVLRNRRSGDRFHPLGAAGSRRLKEFLIDAKVPAGLRSRLLLLCDDEKILWAVGLRTADPVRLTDSTENILRVHIRVHNRPRKDQEAT